MKILRAVATEETATGSSYPSLANFIDSLPPAIVPGQPRVSERPNPATERPAAAPADAAGGTGGSKDGAAAAAEKAAADKEAEAKAATEAAKTAEASKAVKTEEDWEKAPQPRRNDDWQKWKDNRREAETKFKAQIAERDKQVSEAQEKLKELEGKTTVNGEFEAAKAEVERLKAENEAYSNRVLELEVREHPDFKKKFDEPMKDLLGRAKKMAGDKGEVLERILKMEDSDFKTGQLEEFLGEVDSDLTKGRIVSLVEKMDDLKSARESAISETNSWKDNLNGQRTVKAEQRKQAAEAMFQQALKRWQDPKTGLAPFQYQEGAAEWNKGVDARRDTAKQILMGGAKPEMTSDVVARGLALAPFLATYSKERTEWAAEKTKLEETIAQMKGAQPGAGGGTREEPDDENRPKITADMDPTAVTAAFAAPLARQIRQAAR